MLPLGAAAVSPCGGSCLLTALQLRPTGTERSPGLVAGPSPSGLAAEPNAGMAVASPLLLALPSVFRGLAPTALSATEVGQGRVVTCGSLPPPADIFTLHSHLGEKMQIGK